MSPSKASLIFCVLVLYLCALHTVSAQRRGVSSRRSAEQATLQRILDPNAYDSRINPGGNNTNDPVNITVQIYTRAIFEVDDVNNEFGVQVTLRQQWNDPRLVYNGRVGGDDLKYVTVQDLSRLWRADIFVANAKEENLHDFNKPNAFARIYPNGDVLLSERVSLSLSCPMNLKFFPFDTQTCTIRLASYSYVNNDILLSWRADDPLQVKPDLGTQQFTLTSFGTDRCDANTTTGSYSCIVAHFDFGRNREYYMVQVFIPCVMFILIAYLAFWLEPNNIIARLILSVATLFVAATQISEFNRDLPKVPVKSVDNFTGVVLTFIFVTLIETIVVYKLSRREESEPSSNAGGGNPEDPEEENLKPEADSGDEKKKGKKKFDTRKMKSYLARFPKRSDRIDVFFRILYPVAFVLFALVYFVAAAM